MNAKRLIVALVAAVTLTLFMAAAGAQQLAAPQPAAEQDGDPADAFFDRIEEGQEGQQEQQEEQQERQEELQEQQEEAREEAAEAREEQQEEGD